MFSEGCAVGVADGSLPSPLLASCVGVALGSGDASGLPEPSEPSALTVGVAVGSGVAATIAVAVGVGVALGSGVEVGIAVAVGVGVATTAVAVGSGVAVGIAVAVGKAVGGEVSVGSTVACKSPSTVVSSVPSDEHPSTTVKSISHRIAAIALLAEALARVVLFTNAVLPVDTVLPVDAVPLVDAALIDLAAGKTRFLGGCFELTGVKDSLSTPIQPGRDEVASPAV